MPLDITSHTDAPDYLRVLIHGNNATGKSISTLTASSQCPPWIGPLVSLPPTDATPVTLSNIAWLGIDHGALTGAAELKVRVKNYVDASKKDPKMVTAYLVSQIQAVAPMCQSGEIQVVVLDTVSKFNAILDVAHAPLDDRTKIAAAKLRDHAKVWGALSALKADVIVLCHTKATFDMNEDAKKRREARGLPTYIPRIDGTALDLYMNDMDFIFGAERKIVVVDKKPMQQVVWQTTTVNDVQAKSRLQSIPATMPADFRELRKMMGGA